MKRKIILFIMCLCIFMSLSAQRSRRGQDENQPPPQTNPAPAPTQQPTGQQTNRRIPGLSSPQSPGIPGALERVTQSAMRRVPPDSRIAIVNVSVDDRSQRDFIAGELEIILFDMDYIIIDRSELDRIREELNLQYSGEVDDDDAVALGRLSGADYIITSRIDGERDLRRLRLRVLATQTAQVVGVAAEPF
ncbi:MAG: CsgG/HfaB family protein [Candidatus Cloacimonetes bacterium]|nr:CsgG/HfaB family protein [Candidatus Cloacimonadota bacterium]